MKNLKHGWVEGSVQDFLDLSEADVEYIETRRVLSRLLKERRGKSRPSDEKKGMMSVVSVLWGAKVMWRFALTAARYHSEGSVPIARPQAAERLRWTTRGALPADRLCGALLRTSD